VKGKQSKTLLPVLGLTVCALASCSKSPVDTAIDEANKAGAKIMQPLVQADASSQAERMIKLVLLDKPECQPFKDEMREAGKGSPYEATTQKLFIQAQQDACKVGCCKP
jgi:hypothetical protein